MKAIAAKDAKNNFGEMLDTVQREPITIEKHGRAVAVVMSAQEYQQMNLERLRAKLATGEAQRFVIDPRAHRWSAPHGHHGDVPPALGIVFIGARETRPSPGEGAIVFFPDGASTGGRVQLSAKRAAWNIDVAWLTGEVRVARAEAAQP